MQDQLQQELEKIGLSEKEAKVYLAGLAIGPATAQTLAAKAVVNRPTTYVMIESLIKRGLMSSFEKGKRRFFVASPPNQLLYLVHAEKRRLEEKERGLKNLIEELGQTNSKNNDTTAVVFEGLEGFQHWQEDLLGSDVNEIFELANVDQVQKFIPQLSAGDIREKIVKKFRIKSLYSYSGGPFGESNARLQSKYLPRDIGIRGDMIIYGDKVALTSYGNKLEVVVINNAAISQTLSTLFMNLWNQTEE